MATDSARTTFDVTLGQGGVMRIQAITPGVFRIRLGGDGSFAEPGLIRYGIVRNDWPALEVEVEQTDGEITLQTEQAALVVSKRDGRVALHDACGQVVVRDAAAPQSGPEPGFEVAFELGPDERLYGLGDETRDRLQKRGHKDMTVVRNVASYVPIPFLMSTGGWAVFLNTTWFHHFDAGATDPERLTFRSQYGELDYYLIAGASLPVLLDRYTQLTGRPYLLPLWAYGLTYVCDEREVRARDVLYEAYHFRREGIPCDVIGLEPGWMEKRYDFSVDKRWHPERFHVPAWLPGKSQGGFTAALGNMGFKLSLWLCCDYDLSEYEEQQLGPAQAAVGDPGGDARQAAADDDVVKDPHFVPRYMDQMTKPGVGWFEHLKKFVDDGAEAFKLDGANQVCFHPDRRWKNGMTDEEMHNLYPLLLNKQMSHGYREHTGKRSMIYSACGYAGIQQYSATWAGDTGGAEKPLVSLLNHGLSGHSNVSCDMQVWTAAGIHFGFFQPWSQILSWHQYNQPWFLGAKLTPIFNFYAKLRYRLLPYIYTMAQQAARTGMPVARALPLVFPDDPRSDELLAQYMFGEAFLTCAFSDRIYLPEGTWIDYWTDAELHGPVDLPCEFPEDRGGPLFVRAGAIIPTAPDMAYVGQRPLEALGLDIYPCGESAFTLLEDDGITEAHLDGNVAETAIRCRADDRGVTVEIEPRAGAYEGMPARRTFAVRVHGQELPQTVTVNGQALAQEAGGEAEAAAGWSYAARERVVTIHVMEDPGRRERVVIELS